MTFDEQVQKLKTKFPTVEKVDSKPDPHVKVDPKIIHDVVKYLRDEMEFQTIACLGGSDYPKIPALCVVYHFASYTYKNVITLKSYLPRAGEPSIRSIVDLFKGADWLERETYDMFGILFEGHPDLRRILLPDDWKGYPLRKDYQTPDFYNGMPVPLFFQEPEGPAAGGH